MHMCALPKQLVVRCSRRLLQCFNIILPATEAKMEEIEKYTHMLINIAILMCMYVIWAYSSNFVLIAVVVAAYPTLLLYKFIRFSVAMRPVMHLLALKSMQHISSGTNKYVRGSIYVVFFYFYHTSFIHRNSLVSISHYAFIHFYLNSHIKVIISVFGLVHELQ